MNNPHTGRPLSSAARKQVEEYQAVRARARRFIRSGNPAKRVSAQRVERRAAVEINRVYRHEAGL